MGLNRDLADSDLGPWCLRQAELELAWHPFKGIKTLDLVFSQLPSCSGTYIEHLGETLSQGHCLGHPHGTHLFGTCLCNSTWPPRQSMELITVENLLEQLVSKDKMELRLSL